MTIDEGIKKLLEQAEQQDKWANNYRRDNYDDGESVSPQERRQHATECRQLAEWLTELKDLREENKVLMQECDRLIKEKGELLSKVSEN